MNDIAMTILLILCSAMLITGIFNNILYMRHLLKKITEESTTKR